MDANQYARRRSTRDRTLICTASSIVMVGLAASAANAQVGTPPQFFCGKTYVFAKAVADGNVVADQASTVTVRTLHYVDRISFNNGCPPGTPTVTMSVSLDCTPGPDSGPTNFGPFNLNEGFTAININVPVPAGPVRLCNLIVTAQVTFSDGSKLEQIADQKISVGEPAPDDPNLPRLSMQMPAGFNGVRNVHPGDETTFTYQIINRDPAETFTGTLTIDMRNVADLPDIVVGQDNSNVGAFALADPGGGDNFPLAIGPNIECVTLPLPPHEYTSSVETFDVQVPPGQTVEVLTHARSWPLSANGVMNESTALLTGTFSDGSLASATNGTVISVRHTTAPQFACPPDSGGAATAVADFVPGVGPAAGLIADASAPGPTSWQLNFALDQSTAEVTVDGEPVEYTDFSSVTQVDGAYVRVVFDASFFNPPLPPDAVVSVHNEFVVAADNTSQGDIDPQVALSYTVPGAPNGYADSSPVGMGIVDIQGMNGIPDARLSFLQQVSAVGVETGTFEPFHCTNRSLTYDITAPDRICINSTWSATKLPDNTYVGFDIKYDFHGMAAPTLPPTTAVEPGTKESPDASPCDCEPCKQYGHQIGFGSIDPVYLFSGEFYLEETDLDVPGRGVHFVWSRKYRSQIGPNTPQGNGWDFSYNVSLEKPGPNLILRDGHTRKDKYFLQADGTWTRGEFFRVIEQNADGSFTLKFADTGSWDFFALDGSPQAGKLSAITDRNGNMITFEYDGMGRLIVIRDALDAVENPREFIIAYNADGFVESVTDFTGRQMTYEYYQDGDAGGSFGDLKSVTTPAVTGTPNGNDFPDGKTTVYTYTTGFDDDALNHDLLTITDPKGQTWLQNVYAHTVDAADPRFTQTEGDVHFGRVVRQVWGDPGDIVDVFYVPVVPSPENNLAVMKVIVNDRVGNVREFFYDQMNRGVLQREYTGRADPDQVTTTSENRPTDKLRPDDPDFFETRWTYNDDSLLTLVEYPNGNSVQNVYESDLNPDGPRRSAGNLREVHHLPGPLGGDQAEIVELFTYDDDQGGCCGSNFVTQHTDGRGNVTMHTYDEAGNRLQTIHRIPSIIEDWEYNASGQMTAHILPDNGSGHRRRDEWTYYDSGVQFGYLKDEIVDATGFALTTTHEYDLLGRKVRTIDPRGNDTLWTFNQLDQVVREESRPVDLPNGTVRYQTDTFYDLNDNIARVDVQNIDDQGDLQPNTHFSTIYEFDILNHRTRMCQEVGSADLGPEVLDCSGLPAGEFITTEYEYDANRNRTLVRGGEAVNGNQPTNTLTALYDERDLLFREVRAEGDPDQSTTQVDYDGNRNRKAVRYGLENGPRVMTYAYDGYDRQVSAQDPMGNVATIHYDENGNRVVERIEGELIDTTAGTTDGNVLLAEATVIYDAMDRPTREEISHFDAQTQAPIGDGIAATDTVYSDNSQVVQIVDDNGRQRLFAYDTANRRSVVTDDKGNTSTAGYDANSNPVSVTLMEKSDLGGPDELFMTTSAYDALDRLTRRVDSDNNTLDYGYDSRGNRTLSVDALRPNNPDDPGNIVRFGYDGISRLISTTRLLTDDGAGTGAPAGEIVTTGAWDDSSRLISETDDNGNTTGRVYDALNRQTAELFADGTQNTYAYDVHDNAVSATDANGSVSTVTYDPLKRVIQRAVAPGAGVSNDTTLETYAYDGLSRRVRAEDEDALILRGFDSRSNITSESVNSQVTVSLFDGVGNKLTCAYPGGRTVGVVYDDLNRKREISDEAGLIATYDFIGPVRVERRSYANNTRCDYSYDAARRISGTTHLFDPAGVNTVLDARTYAWDRMSNKTMRSDVRPSGPQLTHDYAYDSVYRLIGATVTDTNDDALRATGYTLDGVGNRTDVTGGPDAGTYTLDAGEPADQPVNQYTATPFDSRSYDAKGNLIGYGCLSGDVNNDGALDASDVAPFVDALLGPAVASCADVNGDGVEDGNDIQPFVDLLFGAVPPMRRFAVTYDFRDRMVEHLDQFTGLRSTYAYDTLDRRIARIVDADAVAGGPFETRYFYDERRVCEEQNAAAETLATYVYGRYIDEVLNMQRDVNTDGAAEDYFYHTDDLFNVMAVTDSSGAVAERYDYQDFGAPEFFDASETDRPQSTIGNPLLFTSRRFDPESQWYYYRSRYLDPRAGRFTRRDVIGPWGDDAGLGNAFTYVGNGPFTGVDPYGLYPWVLKSQETKEISDEWGPQSSRGDHYYTSEEGMYKRRPTHYTSPDSYGDDSEMFGFLEIKPTDSGGEATVENTFIYDNEDYAHSTHNVSLHWSRRYKCDPKTGELIHVPGEYDMPKSPAGHKPTDGKLYASIRVTVTPVDKHKVKLTCAVETGVADDPQVSPPAEEQFNRLGSYGEPLTVPHYKSYGTNVKMETSRAARKAGNYKEKFKDWEVECVCLTGGKKKGRGR